jgi:hypothetical protein
VQVKDIFAPIMHALTEVEADKASLSRMRALMRQLEAHAASFTVSYGEEFSTGVVKKRDQPEMPTTVIESFTSRLRDFFYKPATNAAFLLDPINFRLTKSGVIELPFEVLSTTEEDEAICDHAFNIMMFNAWLVMRVKK